MFYPLWSIFFQPYRALVGSPSAPHPTPPHIPSSDLTLTLIQILKYAGFAEYDEIELTKRTNWLAYIKSQMLQKPKHALMAHNAYDTAFPHL